MGVWGTNKSPIAIDVSGNEMKREEIAYYLKESNVCFSLLKNSLTLHSKNLDALLRCGHFLLSGLS